MPLLTVITVCLNSSKTIGKTIDSVLNQTYHNFEYIVIDGKSNDGTSDIVTSKFDAYQEFGKHNRLKYISEKDSGISSAFNKGIALSSGNFILFLNSDDYLDNSNIFEYLSDKLVQSGTIYCGNIRLEELGKTVKSKIGTIGKQFEVLHPASFISKEVFDKVGLFNESFKIGMDTEFFVRAQKMDVKFQHIDRVITNFSTQGISSTNVMSAVLENHRARQINKNSNFFMDIYYFLGGLRVAILSKFWK